MKKWLSVIIMACCLFFSVGTTSAAKSQLIIINKNTNQLAYYENNQLKKTFSVATGSKNNYTPEGTFKIVNKIVNRPYYKGNIPGGSPKNPLGNRWLGLNARQTQGTTYAIHGNNNPASIGSYVSAGCIRMYNADVKWLFETVSINTPVVITNSTKNFESIAASSGFKVKGSPVNSVSTVITLKRGSKGAEVIELQKQLTSLGYSTNGNDGIFGPATEKAVKEFQKNRKLQADGIVGSMTKKALGMI
ncbi:L,D-transpeptidase family protein [Bacillus cihuensis]|uniref:L,D-transpeptidase family protein n=1 Tax=Bacillus cihuensis TaxID=1208599 RepID=UPI000400C868|nr:L,D-transpeptidase family protein [Bacillus cihuensis]